MSQAKRLMDEMEDKRLAAEDIALEAGAVRICEFHAGSFLTNEHDRERPYQRGNIRLKNGEFKGVFDSPTEMAECVKSVIDDAMNECAFPDCPN